MLRHLIWLPLLTLCLFMVVPSLRKISDALIIGNYYRQGYVYSAEEVSGDYGYFVFLFILPVLYVYRNVLRKPFKNWMEATP